MNLAHKIQLKPNKEQEQFLAKASGVARFTYNWALNKWSEQYKAGLKPNALKLKKEFNSIKHTFFPWIKESPKDVNQQVFTNLGKAFNSFFKNKKGYPSFKKKGIHDSFYISNDKFYIKNKHIKLPKIGLIKLTEEPRFQGKILNAVISRKANKWFVSISFELKNYSKENISTNHIGIDLGLISTLFTSDKQEFNASKPLKNNIKKLRRLSKSYSRKVKGSKNKFKSRMKLAKLHARIANIRQDFTHKMTSNICSKNQTISIEDLNVKGMTANHKLARALSDVSFGEIRRQFEYKSKIYNNRIVVIPRFYPSTQECSKCGNLKKDLTISDRVYICKKCGLKINRDLNASITIDTLGYREFQACGQTSSGVYQVKRETSLSEAGIFKCSLLST